MILVTAILYLFGSTPALADEDTAQGHVEANVVDIATLTDEGEVQVPEDTYYEIMPDGSISF